ncbi:MAG: nucleotidyl transferase AbiEii/AbiGii toxin family protein [Candidatus Thorarchaeota archaeon]
MREFIEDVSSRLRLDKGLVEKDFVMHQILLELSESSFGQDFAFKGGSCLVKHYIGYYRFSVDLDFTFLNQSIFEGLSQKEIRKRLSKRIDAIGSLLEGISKRRGLDFRCEKDKREYVELGGGNKFSTFKLWLQSIVGTRTFIKVQVNFVEKIAYPPRNATLGTICPNSKELSTLYPTEYMCYTEPIRFKVYDIKEILCEKIRAILTRREFRARDLVDVYFISKKRGIDFRAVQTEAEEKLRFILELYEKYRRNLEEKVRILSIENLSQDSFSELLIVQIDKREYYRFLEEFVPWLKELAERCL